MTDLFLSYKAEDRSRIVPLVQALEQDGFSVWWDAHIGGGDDWRETILRHLESAKCVIVVWSRRSVGTSGEFVRDEASRAKRRGTYLPVRIDKVDPPLGFGETQALDLQGWKGDRSHPRYQAVLTALRDRLGLKPRRRNSPGNTPDEVHRRAILIGGGAAAAVLAGTGTWLWVRPKGSKSDSIAVLPFANLSGDPGQAYFSDGIAEELRSSLSRVAGLKVVGRTSSEAVRNDDAETAARKLGVANILTGSVRQSPSTIRVSAQLVDGKNGLERWSENYDRAPGDAIKIQVDIAEKVARALSTTLAGVARAAIIAGGTENPAAQQLVLQAVAAKHEGSEKGLKAALGLVDKALALDPRYAEAYVLKARTLNDLANIFANATELHRYRAEALLNARKALQLTSDLGSAHNALGEFYGAALELRAADREYKRALELAPGDADTIRAYAHFASLLGRSAESLPLSEEAIALDPLNSDSYETRFLVLMNRGTFEDAVRFTEQVKRNSPELFHWSNWLTFALIALGRTDQARQVMSTKAPEEADRLVAEGILFGRDGNEAAAQRNIDKLFVRYGAAASYQYAEIYSQAGDKERALAALDRALKIRDSGLSWIKVDPFLDPLRSDPRFQAIVRKLDFPT